MVITKFKLKEYFEMLKEGSKKVKTLINFNRENESIFKLGIKSLLNM
jgi:ASC-1-like (ASCH) protein